MGTNLEQKFKYIDEINFQPLLERLTDENKCSAIDPLMERELAEQLIYKYRCFLKLNVLYPTENLYPSFGMDVIWHYHILDTVAYFKDCEFLFGNYMHHAPNFAQNGYDNREATSVNTMTELFKKHFGVEYLTIYENVTY